MHDVLELGMSSHGVSSDTEAPARKRAGGPIDPVIAAL
jgi:hypothetical protein